MPRPSSPIDAAREKGLGVCGRQTGVPKLHRQRPRTAEPVARARRGLGSRLLVRGASCRPRKPGHIEALTSVPVDVNTYAGRPREADVLTVGGGPAGVTAAIAARQGGANVILLEGLDFTAGNSSPSSDNLLLGGTSVQEAAGIEDDAEAFYTWIMRQQRPDGLEFHELQV